MSARFFCPEVAPGAWRAGLELELPEGAARHVQVLRHQPGDALRLFDGHGGDWQATVLAMARRSVQVRLDQPLPVHRELPAPIHLAVGMPANERMDALVEKATELGVTALWPLHTRRSVLRLSGERAAKKIAHWQAVAVSAAEQCGRDRIPAVHPVQDWAAFWGQSWPRLSAGDAAGVSAATMSAHVLTLEEGAEPWWQTCAAQATPVAVLLASGPEGGLDEAELAQARAAGAQPASLGPRVLRADTAPLQALGVWAARWSA
ncbi:16S rRNA (uracil(1498)-N(3))-methyltransferase [Amphibiibacter pelophylacis]|uniref:16S rRNA (Uracil(1498)-N(3))-methyltransferase n=1 Tax=Amphibiibacter pelophylacis TaxID=1799477 RepID=A0ACC6P4V6_9BURK